VKKIKNEPAIFKAAIDAGVKYGEVRGVVEFEPTDSLQEKALFIYKLLTHDGLIVPLPEIEISQKTIRLRLVKWHIRQLPKDDPLLR